MDDDTPTNDSKLTRSKLRWAEEGKFITGRAGSDRLPPGQHLVNDWPVLDLGKQPDVPLDRWRLVVDGLVARPITLDWAGFEARARNERVNDILSVGHHTRCCRLFRRQVDLHICGALIKYWFEG